MLQSDGGGEYTPISTFCQQNGIIHRKSCPHTPQQNGVAERKHRHITEIALTLLAKASIPLRFWDEAVSTAVFLINRLPSSTLNHKSPFELLFQPKPDYAMLKVFGCLCFPYTRPFDNVKFQFKSVPCIFLGYCLGYKGYKCLDPVSKKVYIYRHVTFNDAKFFLSILFCFFFNSVFYFFKYSNSFCFYSYICYCTYIQFF